MGSFTTKLNQFGGGEGFLQIPIGFLGEAEGPALLKENKPKRG